MSDLFPKPSVSRRELLDADGRDRAFRRMVYDLLTVGARMQEVRDRLAGEIGVSGPQYAILMAIAHLQDEEGGVGVRTIAGRLHVSGPFITAQVNKLVGEGLVAKSPNPQDGRGVILRLTGVGEERLASVAPEIRRANDTFFGPLSADEFRLLRNVASRLEKSSELAVRQGAD